MKFCEIGYDGCMMKLYLFGVMRLVTGEQTRLLTGTNAKLLSLLGLSERTAYTMSRSRLAGTLWPDVSEERSRQLLSNGLYRLRQVLGKATTSTGDSGRYSVQAFPLHTDDDLISLNDVWVDVTQFGQLAGSDRVADWLTAVNLYHGDLLEELDDSWLLAARAELREQYLALLAHICDTFIAENEYERALLIAHRWTLADPLNETAHTIAMQLYAQIGRPAAALQQYNRLVDLLRDEMDLSPTIETEALAAQIRSEREQTKSQQLPISKLLIGRQEERANLIASLQNLETGRGSVVLLEGEPGIGKTRLLEELADAATWRQMLPFWGKAVELATPHLFAPLPEALQAATAGSRLLQVKQQLLPFLQHILIPLLPRLQDGLPLFANGANRYGVPSVTVQTAVSKLLAILTDISPLVLLFDDVQWADDQFWDVLPALVDESLKRPLLIILSYRSHTLRQNEVAWSAIQQLDQSCMPLRLLLKGLSEQECEAYVQSLGQQMGTQRSLNQSTHLHQLSNGNPLVLQEFVLSDAETAVSFDRLLAHRVNQLTTPERQVAAAASVLGREFSYGTWHAMGNGRLPIQSLLRLQFIQETAVGYAFQHDLVRAHFYNTLSERERRKWHRQAGDILSREVTPLATLAWHYEQAEEWLTAVSHYHKAAERALQTEAYQTARRHCTHILHLLEQQYADEADSLPIRLLQLQIIQIKIWSSEDEAEAIEIERLAVQYDDQETLLNILLVRLNLLVAQGKIDEMQAVGKRALQLAHESGSRSTQINVLNHVAFKTATVVRDTDTALELSTQAIALAETILDEPYLLTTSLFALSLSHLINRSLEEARQSLAHAEKLIERNPDLASLEPELFFYKAIMAQLTGAWEKSRQLQHHLIEIHRAVDNMSGLQSALYNASHVASFIGLHEEAIMFAEELMQQVRKNSSDDDQYYLHYYGASLIECYTMAGDFETAEKGIPDLLNWLKEEESGRGPIYGWTVVGTLRYYQGDLEAAYYAHSRALALAEHRGSVTSSPLLCHAEAAHLTGRFAEAQSSFERARSQIKTGFVSSNLTYFYYVHYLLTNDVAQLKLARQSMFDCANLLQNPNFVQAHLHQLPLHDDINRAWQEWYPKQNLTRLAHVDAPLGVPLGEADWVKVRLTIEMEDEEADLLLEGKVALRRYRLQRIVAEATVQGGVPTHQDLAKLLGVTVRTIERDSRALSAAGTPLQTRRTWK